MTGYLPNLLSDAEALCVVFFKDETKSWTRKIERNLAVTGLWSSVEQHVLDPHMIVEPFEVAQPRRSTSGMQMQGGRAVSRQIDVMGLAQCRGLHKAADAAAARHVGLQHIDRGQREQAAKIVEVVTILAGGDVHPGWRALAHQREAGKIIRVHRLFEPPNVVFGNALGQRQSLFGRERAIGIDEQAGLADRGTCSGDPLWVARRVAANFHFDPTTTIVPDPGGKLLAQPRVGIAGEPTAAIDRNGVTAATEHRRHGGPEELGLQIPKCRIDCRDRGCHQPAAAEITNAAP